MSGSDEDFRVRPGRIRSTRAGKSKSFNQVLRAARRAGHTAPQSGRGKPTGLGGIVEVRRFGGADDQRPTLVLANRSDFDLAGQVTAPGATWLDHRMVEREPMPLFMGGFGREVRDAMIARAEHLADAGLASRQGQRIVLQSDLLATLRRRELDAVGAKLSAETGLPHLKAAAGETVAGTYRQRLFLTSGRFAMIDNGLGFQLVPWAQSLEKQLGRHVAGVMNDGGGINWELAPRRSLSL